MADVNIYKSLHRDEQFGNKELKLLKALKFPKIYYKKVDMKKVNFPVIKAWTIEEIARIMGKDDDVLANLVINFLDCKEPDARLIHINLSGFLDFQTGKFVKKLWSLLLSAQSEVSGIPRAIVDEKKKEIMQKRIEQERISAQIEKFRLKAKSLGTNLSAKTSQENSEQN